MIETALDLALVLVLLVGLATLGTSRLLAVVRYFATQSAVLALVPLLVQIHHHEGVGAHGWILFGATLGIKVAAVPWLLQRSIREAAVRTEVEPFIGYATSLGLGGGLVALSFILARQLPLPVRPPSDLMVPVAFSMLLIGLLTLVSRKKAVTQVVGYLVMENGIFLFGVLLIEAMPYLIEIGVLLDLFVGVFVMGIVIFHINREFDHIDVHELTTLKD